MARGLAGAALFAVPVAVAAAIGFGSSISGVAGGLTAVTSGPDAVPASAQTGPQNLNKTVVALSPKAGSTSPRGNNSGTGGSPGLRSGTGIGGTGGGTGSSVGSGGSGGSGSTGSPTGSTPSVPSVNLPGSGSGTNSPNDQINGAVNNVVGGVNQTLNGLLGH